MIKLDTAKIVNINPAFNTDINALKNMIKQITKQAEYGVSDSYKYNPISLGATLTNKDYKAVALTISQDEDKLYGHMLEISVLDNLMQAHKRPLVYGNKQAIMQYLKSYKTLNLVLQDFRAIMKEIKLT